MGFEFGTTVNNDHGAISQHANRVGFQDHQFESNKRPHHSRQNARQLRRIFHHGKLGGKILLFRRMEQAEGNPEQAVTSPLYSRTTLWRKQQDSTWKAFRTAEIKQTGGVVFSNDAHRLRDKHTFGQTPGSGSKEFLQAPLKIFRGRDTTNQTLGRPTGCPRDLGFQKDRDGGQYIG